MTVDEGVAPDSLVRIERDERNAERAIRRAKREVRHFLANP